MSTHEAITRFMRETQTFLAREGVTEPSVRQVGERLAELVREPGLIFDDKMRPMHDSAATSTIVASLGDAALTLMLAEFPAAAPTPVHDHDSWGIACVVAGHDRYMQWERMDAGDNPGHARLRLLYERELGVGDYVVWMAPPHDIHSQQGMGGTAKELVLFGKNPMLIRRHYFDLEAGTVREALPQ